MRKPLHELKIHDFFYYPRGKWNAITDVPGVTVGHHTVYEGADIRTGVSVVIPDGLEKHKFVAGGYAFNANGEVTGLQYILEEGRLISPIFLTNTLSVGDVFSAVVDYYKEHIALPVVGECWDGYLNDIWGRHVTADHVRMAIESAKDGVIEQGNVGAGTGMMSFGFKAGIGTSSRRLNILGKEYAVGVFVNNNMGSEEGTHRYFRIDGKNVAKIIGENPQPQKKPHQETHQSSSILIIATDVPLNHRQLNRLARHAVLGFGRIGLVSYTGSGDFVITFSTGNTIPNRDTQVMWKQDVLEESLLDAVFEATLEAVEEAYLNSLLTAEDMTGKDNHKVKALPVHRLFPDVKK